MTYLQDKKRKQDRLLKYTIAVVVFVLIVVGTYRVQDVLYNIPSQIAAFFGKTLDGVSTRVSGSFSTKAQLQTKVNELETELAQYRQKEGRYALQELELQDLRAALYANSSEYRKAKVNAVSSLSLYGTFLIEAPKEIIIQETDYIVGDSGSLIGIVTQASDNKGTIQSLDRLQTAVSVFLLDSNLELSVTGLSRGVLIAKVPRDTEIEIGDVVVLSADQTIPVGTVIEFSRDERNPYTEVYIRMNDTIQKTKSIFILQK
jgi:cell shape-determining protein MreC